MHIEIEDVPAHEREEVAKALGIDVCLDGRLAGSMDAADQDQAYKWVENAMEALGVDDWTVTYVGA